MTNDQGNNWIEFTNDVPGGLSSFYAPTNNLGFAAGSGGLILKYDDTTYVPVELVSFEGSVKDHQIVLSWFTESELNNQGFYIEKSFDVINWEIIGFVNGNGTTTESNSYSFVDRRITDLKVYYRLKQLDYDGSFTYTKIIEIEIPVNNFLLFQNYPNPFNPTTTMKFALPINSRVKINVYNSLGQLVETLIDKEMESGYHEVNFDASRMASGVYLYQLQAQDYVSVKKMLLLK